MRKSDFMRWGRLFVTAVIVGSFSFPPQTIAAEKKLTKNKKASDSRWLSPAPSPVPFMTFDELAKLDHTQRLKYVRALRQSAREIEKMQFMFRDSRRKNASLEQQNWQRLYAFLISEPAEAQTEPVGDSGHRGRKPGDKCIYGYNLSNYPTDGKRQPFECEIPLENRCAGNGVKCGAFLSGLGAGLKNDCIPYASRHMATQHCDTIRKSLSDSNGGEIQSAFADAEKYFGFKEQNSTITKEEMVDAEAAKILQNLAKHAYDDRAYAMLIYVLGLYKKSFVTPPVGGDVINKVYAKLLNPEYFEKNLTDVQTAINQVFTDYLSHCNSDVPDEEIDALTDANWANKYQGASAQSVAGLELERINAAKKYKQQGGSKKVEDITEIPECRAIRARIAGITNVINTARGSYPNPTGPLPPGGGQQDPIVAEPNPKPTGCSTNVTSDKHLLFQSSARCMICLSDRAVAQTAKENGLSNEEAKKRETYGTSTKWMSLLSTMALACGDGNDGTHFTTEVINKYRMLFGHCSNDTYKWDDGAVLTQEDRNLIEDWSTKEVWSGNKKGKATSADIDNDFTRIYGIKYETATKMFCNMNRFKKGIFTGKIRTLNLEYKSSGDPAESPSARRGQFLAFLDGDKKNEEAVVSPDKKKDSVAADLLNCMKESATTAKKLYSDNGGYCTASQKIDGNHQKNMGTMINGVKSGEAAVMYNSGECWVSTQIEKDDAGGGLENIGFAIPEKVTYQPEKYNLLYDGKGGLNSMPVLAFDSEQVAKHNKGGRYKICPETGTRKCENLNNMSFLYPNAGFCAVASQNKQQSGGAGKSK